MKNDEFVAGTIQRLTENWAKRCQSSRYSVQSLTRSGSKDIDMEDNKPKLLWFKTSLPLVALMFLLGIPALLSAQNQKVSWSNLNSLRVGQGPAVIESSMKHQSGEFVAVTDELLTLKGSGTDILIKREDVARVSTSSGPKAGTSRCDWPRSRPEAFEITRTIQ
jgi:hypothetical protein